MQKIGNITNTATAAGEFTDGSVASGISPTILDAGWFNTIQRELVNMVQSAGITLDPTNDAQVLAAIQKLFLQTANNFSEIKAAGTVAQAAALANLGSSDGTINGRLLAPPQIFTSSGVYTKNPAARLAIIQQVGGGAAGAGTTAGSLTNNSVGGGGGAGTYVKFSILLTGITMPVPITIGAAGTGATGTAGTAGGSTSFGTFVITAGGRAAATVSVNASAAAAGGGSQAAAPTINSPAITINAVNGQPGAAGYMVAASGGNGGNGGESPLGGSGAGAPLGIGGTASGYGSGGGGALNINSTSSAAAGGNGTAGAVIIWEYA